MIDDDARCANEDCTNHTVGCTMVLIALRCRRRMCPLRPRDGLARLVFALLVCCTTAETATGGPAMALRNSERSLFARLWWDQTRVIEAVAGGGVFSPNCVRTRFAAYVKEGGATAGVLEYAQVHWSQSAIASYAAVPTPCGRGTVEQAATCTPYDVAYAPATIDTSKEVRLDLLARLVQSGGRVVLNVSLTKGLVGGIADIDSYIERNSNGTLQAIEYFSDTDGFSMASVSMCQTVLVSTLALPLRRTVRSMGQLCKRTRRIMFVAHPDDELIFGWHGFLQFHPSCWHVVSITGKGKPRERQFGHVMRFLGVDSFEVWSYRDCADCVPFVGEQENGFDAIEDRLRHTIMRVRPDVVVTHNPFGEYGHLQHVRLSQILSHIVEPNSLFYFNPRVYDTASAGVRSTHVLMQNIPATRVLYPQEYGRIMAFDTTMSTPFISATDFTGNIQGVRQALHLYCTHINSLWNVEDHLKQCYDAVKINDIKTAGLAVPTGAFAKPDFERRVAWPGKIMASPDPTRVRLEVDSMLDRLVKIVVSTAQSPAGLGGVENFLERKKIEDLLVSQKMSKHVLHDLLYKKLVRAFKPVHCQGCDVHTSNVHNKCLVPFVRGGKTFFHPFAFRAWIAICRSTYRTAVYIHSSMELYIAETGTANEGESRRLGNNISLESHFRTEDLKSYLGEKYLFHLCNIQMGELEASVKAMLESLHFQIEHGSSSLPQLVAVDMILDNAGVVYPLQYHKSSFAAPDNRVGQTVFHDHFALMLHHHQHATDHPLADPLKRFHRFRLVNFYRNDKQGLA